MRITQTDDFFYPCYDSFIDVKILHYSFFYKILFQTDKKHLQTQVITVRKSFLNVIQTDNFFLHTQNVFTDTQISYLQVQNLFTDAQYFSNKPNFTPLVFNCTCLNKRSWYLPRIRPETDLQEVQSHSLEQVLACGVVFIKHFHTGTPINAKLRLQAAAAFHRGTKKKKKRHLIDSKCSGQNRDSVFKGVWSWRLQSIVGACKYSKAHT